MTDDVLPRDIATGIDSLCASLYPDAGPVVSARIHDLLDRYRDLPQGGDRWRPGAGDSILITYGDQISTPGEHPLRTLSTFCRTRLASIPVVHLLPFFPYSSDDGFSVVDYLAVDPDLGTWDDIDDFSRVKRLMFDAVINHVSAQSDWFADYLAGKDPHRRLAIEVEPATDLHEVVRPRTSPLLTRFETAAGPRDLWTTFSPDQIDLNYADPDTLLNVLEVLCEYVRRGASLIRLDAIAFSWKQIGTGCMSLPNTHRLVQLIRTVLDAIAPQVTIITETNVPHAENVSYFGTGREEAQLVYNFALPPLVLHSFTSGDASVLSRWAATLLTPSPDTWFFNFLASHDGIGVRGAEALLSDADVDALAARVRAHGGLVGMRTMPDGTERPYELNINYFDALSNPDGDEPLSLQVARFLCAYAICFALPGVPGIYAHSLLGSRGDRELVRTTGQNRSINRAKLDLTDVEAELDSPGTLRAMVFDGMTHLLEARAGLPDLDPSVAVQVENRGPGLFAIRRGATWLLHNVTGDAQRVDDLAGLRDAISGRSFDGTLAPYGFAWLVEQSS